MGELEHPLASVGGNEGDHGIVQFGITVIVCSYALRLLAVEGFFQDALHEILKLKTVLAGVDLEAAVEIGRDFKGRCWRWFGWRECHGVKLR